MAKTKKVERPTRKSEFTVVFGSAAAERGWRDVKAVRLNQLVDAWDWLTTAPTTITPLNYPLRGRLATVNRADGNFQRWQLKLNLRDGVRICFYVDGQTVYLEQVHTSHPNETL